MSKKRTYKKVTLSDLAHLSMEMVIKNPYDLMFEMINGHWLDVDESLDIDRKIDIFENKKIKLNQKINECKISLFWLIISAIIGGIIGYLDVRKISIDLTIYILVVVLVYVGLVKLYKLYYERYRNEIEYKLITWGANKLQENIQDDFFNTLVKLNFKYLDQYYLQTKNQANKSFILTAIAVVVGFLVIIVGIIFLLFNERDAGYISACAGIIIEFISSIFFYFYNRTIQAMSEYHKKLVLSQNVSLALKVTEDFNEDHKYLSRMEVIKEITKDINKHLAENSNHS